MTTRNEVPTREPLILVVDGHSMVFRAWFALSRGGGLTNSAGQQTHGAYGFLRNLIATIREHSPTHIAVTFDTRAPTFRDELFDEYKAQRPPIDPELHAQIPMVESVLAAMKVPVFAIDGFEADDVVGTIVRLAEAQGIRSLILTGDADQLQLVNAETQLLMYSGFGDTKIYDIQGVQDRYDGLGPEFVAEIKALEGDPSDNIPGIPKIGPKAARTVLRSFGHFGDLYANLDAVGEIPSKELRGAKGIMNRLRDGKKVAYDGLKLTTIVTDVPIDIDFSNCRIGGYDRSEVVASLTTLGFGEGIVRSIPSAEDAERGVFPLPITGRAQGELFGNGTSTSKTTTKVAADLGKYSIVATDDELQALVARLGTADGFAYDTETNGTNAMQDEMVGMSFSNAEGEGWYIPLGHRTGEQVDRARALEIVAPLFADDKVPKAAHNANFDMMVLRQAGIDINNASFDTMIAASLCGHNRIGLKDLALELYRAEMTPITDLIGTGRKQITMSEVDIEAAGPYASADADFTYRLWRHFEDELDGHNARGVFEGIEMKLLPVIIDMQHTGMVVETDVLKRFSAALGEEIAQIKQVTNVLLGGRKFNIASNKQLGDILIDEWKAPPTRRLKTGWSMNADALDRIRNSKGLDDRIYQLIDAVLRFRELSKLKSTYADALPKIVNPATGRVHTTFNQAGSATGRLASNDPNVQNIPVRTELGREIRNAFSTMYKSGWQLLSADYSQIELRILAHMSQEPGLLRSFRNGEDIHNATAQAMYDVQDVTSEQRRIAKILNFGVIYGLGPQGVARQTDLSVQQGREFINLYFGRYPGIRDFIDRQKQVAKIRGYAETLNGRRRYLPDLRSSNKGHRAAAERVAVNMPIQGTAADVIKIAMINIAAELERRGMDSRMTAQVHDELIFEVAPGELEEMTSIAHDMMPAAMSLEVPLLVDTKTGVRWGELE
jgi:DNA polymerase-1